MVETLHNFATAVENLVSVNRDAEQGFRAAADAVTDASLKRMFVELSTERAGFASEIQAAVRRLGFEPANPLGTAGTLRGIWISLKGAILANQEHAVLEETELAEEQSLKIYREALVMVLQPDLRGIVERQFASIQASHARIGTLRDQTAPVPAAKA
jgi:uncharacterized protein (TIGR02284 family)